MDALNSFNQAFVWADEMNSWMGGLRQDKPSIPFDKIKPLSQHVEDIWLNVFSLLMLQYAETLSVRLPIRQRIETLLNILCQVFSIDAMVMVSLRKQEEIQAWYHRPGFSIQQVRVRMDDTWLADQLNRYPDESVTFNIPGQGNVVLHICFEHSAPMKSLSEVNQSAISRLWVPLLEQAMFTTGLQRRISDDQILYQVARMANTIHDKDELITEYLRFIVPLLGADQAAIIAPSADRSSKPEWKWFDFSVEENDLAIAKADAGGCLEGSVLVPDDVMSVLNRRVFYSPAVREFDAYSSVFLALHPHAVASTRHKGIDPTTQDEAVTLHYTVAPFFANTLDQSVFGEIDIHQAPTAILLRHRGTWGASQHRILAEANEWLSHALYRAIKLEEMARQASYDVLTGLLNRRALYQRFCMEAERSMRNGLPMSIAVLDIDYFKQFNDNHGHLIGDTVLRELSDFLSQHIRRSDVLSRYGGEEFVILLPETTAEEAWDLIDRLRDKAFKCLRVPTPDKQNYLPITFSAGVSLVTLPNDDLLSVHTVDDPEWKIMLDVAVSQADEALYEAKNNGRNQVRCAT